MCWSAERAIQKGSKRIARVSPAHSAVQPPAPDKLLRQAAKLSASNSCERWLGCEADAPGLGGNHQLTAAASQQRIPLCCRSFVEFIAYLESLKE